MRMSAAIFGGKRLDWPVRKSVHSPNRALNYDDRPKSKVQNSLHDMDERQNLCDSAFEQLTLPVGPATWGISVEMLQVTQGDLTLTTQSK